MKRRLILVLAVAVVVAGAVTGGVLWLNRGSDYPDDWDSRVEDLVAFVEEKRGLEFEHPVYIDFLSEKEFEKEVTSDESDLTDEDREEIEQVTGLMRALGLMKHGVDLFDAVNDLSGGGVIGLYDYDDERIRVRGEELTPAVEATLVHELTHVLQDQHYDLGGKSDEFEERDDSSAAAAWDALVEGDADRIEDAWVEALSRKEKRALDKSQDLQAKGGAARLAEVPPFLVTAMGSSYALGEQLLALAIEVDGRDAVDALFDDPPTSEENLLDPWTVIADDEDAIEVDTPELPRKAEEFDKGTFGAPSLAFVLAERIDPLQALVAADGWGGDRYVAYERDERSCMRIDYRGDSPGDVDEMRTAWQDWIALGPPGTSSVRDLRRGVRIESCDPGRAAVDSTGGSETVLTLAVIRTLLAVDALEKGTTQRQARCFAAGVITAFTTTEFLELYNSSEPNQSALERIGTVQDRCR